MYFLVTSVYGIPSWFAFRMILSSMSVKFRIYVTS